MRFIKLGFISVVFLFLLITAISLLLPSTVNISKTIDINAPFDSLYNNINDVTKWKSWYANYDTSNVSFSAKKTGEGAFIIMNKTTVTIFKSSPEQITTLWQFGKTSLEGEFNFFRQRNSSQTTVQWHFIQHVKWYPWEKFASIVSAKVLGPGIEKSLDNLKRVCEK